MAGGSVSLVGVFEKPQELPMNKLWIKNINISHGGTGFCMLKISCQ
jgi:alcohol dehydrogenase